MDLSNFTPVGAITGLVGKVLDRVLPEDKAQKEAANLEVLKLVQNGELAQMIAQTDINKTEAASGKPFEAGWRPFIGWICGVSLAVNFVVAPLAEFVMRMQGNPVVFPRIDMAPLWTLMTGMLGLSVARTYEKTQGVQAQH